jgi:flagellar hook assembly protein FlgD
MPDTEILAELQVFDMSGRLLRSMKQSLFSTGYTSGEFEWDGRDANGGRMEAGIYPYRVILRTDKGQEVWQSSKMVIGY